MLERLVETFVVVDGDNGPLGILKLDETSWGLGIQSSWGNQDYPCFVLNPREVIIKKEGRLGGFRIIGKKWDDDYVLFGVAQSYGRQYLRPDDTVTVQDLKINIDYKGDKPNKSWWKDFIKLISEEER